MSNPAAIFYYDEQATNLRSKLVQQGGKKLLFSSVKNFKPPKVAKKNQRITTATTIMITRKAQRKTISQKDRTSS